MKTKFFPAHHSPVESLMHDFFGNGWNGMDNFINEAWSPSANISENENEWNIELSVPGIGKENFQLNVDKNRLTISASLEETKEDKKYNYREFKAASFSRSFNLPQGKVDEEAISARYDNGILSVTVPKLEEARDKGPRTIEIQ